MFITPDEARQLLPRVGERRQETMTKVHRMKGENETTTPLDCTVIYVHPEHLWYMVQFKDTGVRECYKVPGPQGGAVL